MATELVVFWRLADGTRCVVAEHGDGWRLLVIKNGVQLLAEDHRDAEAVIRRAAELRPAREDDRRYP